MSRPVSVIATVYNEIDSIEPFIRSLTEQSRTPEEIVIVDAGSTDGTVDVLRRLQADVPYLSVVVEPGNRSQGRNTAIEVARHELIACTDAGSSPRETWLEELMRPFDDDAEWVAGFYEVEAESVVDRCAGLTIVYVMEEVDPDHFLPSGRSMAVSKEAWRAVGGFPEDVEFGEDTLFDQRLIEAGYRHVFAPHAVVGWHPPKGLIGLARTTFRWGRGDGTAGLRGHYYKRAITAFGVGGALAALVALLRPKLLPILALALVRPTWKTIRHKLRHEPSPAKYVLLPVSRATATTSNLAGYVVGRAIGE